MTDKPFDHEEYTRERLRQTTTEDGSAFKGHLVHKPGRIEADQQTIAELRAQVRQLEREHPALVYALEKLDTQDAIIAELRKALEEIAAIDREDTNTGYTAWDLATSALEELQ